MLFISPEKLAEIPIFSNVSHLLHHHNSYDDGGGPALRSCSLIWFSTGISPLAMPPSTDRRVRVCRNSRPGLWPRRMEDWGTRRRGRWGDDGLSDAIATQLSLATSLSD